MLPKILQLVNDVLEFGYDSENNKVLASALTMYEP